MYSTHEWATTPHLKCNTKQDGLTGQRSMRIWGTRNVQNGLAMRKTVCDTAVEEQPEKPVYKRDDRTTCLKGALLFHTKARLGSYPFARLFSILRRFTWLFRRAAFARCPSTVFSECVDRFGVWRWRFYRHMTSTVWGTEGAFCHADANQERKWRAWAHGALC